MSEKHEMERVETEWRARKPESLGESLGFTWEDVRVLRDIGCCLDHIAACDRLSNVIAGLLNKQRSA